MGRFIYESKKETPKRNKINERIYNISQSDIVRIVESVVSKINEGKAEGVSAKRILDEISGKEGYKIACTIGKEGSLQKYAVDAKMRGGKVEIITGGKGSSDSKKLAKALSKCPDDWKVVIKAGKGTSAVKDVVSKASEKLITFVGGKLDECGNIDESYRDGVSTYTKEYDVEFTKDVNEEYGPMDFCVRCNVEYEYEPDISNDYVSGTPGNGSKIKIKDVSPIDSDEGYKEALKYFSPEEIKKFVEDEIDEGDFHEFADKEYNDDMYWLKVDAEEGRHERI